MTACTLALRTQYSVLGTVYLVALDDATIVVSWRDSGLSDTIPRRVHVIIVPPKDNHASPH
jgi:hypothetical protein